MHQIVVLSLTSEFEFFVIVEANALSLILHNANMIRKVNHVW